MDQRIAVLGTGANGSCISADLIRTGHDVTMIDQWPAHVETMRRDGLTISAPDEEVYVKPDVYHICDLCTLNRVFDVVLICMKAYDARWSAELIKPYLAGDGIAVGVQNAMTAKDISEIVGPSRTIGCVVELASEMFEPGRIKRSITREKTWFGVGALEPSMAPRVPEIEAILKNVGRVSLSEDILSAKWMKLMVNAMSMGPEAMLGLTSTEAMKLPGMRDLMLKCGEEALRAGQSQGYTIEPIFGLTREDIDGSNRLLEFLLDKIVKDVGTTSVDSTRQDHIRGRYSEVDLINGAVVEENTKRGDASPVNAVVVELTRRIHAREIAMDPSNLQVAMSLLAGQR